MDYIFKRAHRYYYRRRVPEEVRPYDQRDEVKISLKTKDRSEAYKKAEIYNYEIEKFWKALVQSGKSDDSGEKYKAAMQLARLHGFAYKTAEEIAEKSTLNEIIERLSVDIEKKEIVTAVLGGIDAPKITLEEAIDLYWPLASSKIQLKNENQARKWRNPRKAAMLNLINLVGNMPISDINRSHILEFRSWWVNKIAVEGRCSDTANKQLTYLKDILETVSLQHAIPVDIDLLFRKLKLPYKDRSRPPFEADYVENTLLPALKGLYEDARYVIMIMADTGMRDSEVITRCADDIKLDEPVPYVWVRPNKKTAYLKTQTSERKIPLVGNALYAFRQRPNGFDRWENADSFSSYTNRWLTTNNLRPTPRHTAYSLRHCFKDRLRDAQAPEEIIDELMGHKKSGPKYGRGHTLETKLLWMDKVAFKVSENHALEL